MICEPYFWPRLSYLLVFLAATLSSVYVQAQTSSTAPLIQSSNLSYQGSFRVPGCNAGGQANACFEYGGTALSYNPARNSLFMVGHDWDQFVGEISIPSIGGTASLLQTPRDATPGNSVGDRVGGTLVYNNRLYLARFTFYDATGSQTQSHYSRSIDLATGSANGPYRVGSLGAGFYAGYMATIPSEWQQAFGGPALTGNCCLSIISRTSYGPAAFAFEPSTIGSTQSALPLVYYTGSNPLEPYGAGGIHPLFSGATKVRGIAFPSGTRSVLFIGTTGLGSYCYGEAADCGDPTNGSKGEHAYPYAAYVWAYDANDLAAVRSGTKQAWSVRPYATWQLSNISVGFDGIGGAAYDPATGKLFVSQKFGDGERPRIHVYNITVGSPPAATPAPTVTIAANPVSVTAGSNSTLSWSSTNATSCSASGGWSGTKNLSGSQSTGALTTTGTYSLTCTGAGGSASQSATVTVTLATAPTVTVSASPASVTSGSSSTLSWNSTNATSCTASGAWSGAKATSGSQSTGNLTATATYSMTCTGAGGSGSQSATVTVTSPPTVPTVTISASPNSIISASSSTLSWTSTSATSCTASGAWSGAKATSGSESTGILSANAMYTLTCTGTGGSASQSATVVVTPPATSPPPSSGVSVSNVSGLKAAIAGLTSNATVLLADGTYNLTDTLYLPQNISNVTIKGASGNRDAVIIKGPGMTNSAVSFGFWADKVNGITFQDMTIRDFNQHAIILNGGVENPVYRNLHIIDIGDQFLKNNPTGDGLNGIDNGILENSLLEYSGVAPDSYTNGLDVHRAKNWTIRGNTFRNFRSTAGLTGPAILVWNGSSDTTIVRNTFINNQRDISLGLDPTKPAGGVTDHARGLVANNFIYRNNVTAADVPIAVYDSPQTKVYHNTILVNGGYPFAIEYRFTRTTGVDIKNNLADAAISSRDGATGTTGNNVTTATAGLFVSAVNGDLHLTPTATLAIDKGAIVSVNDDIDGDSRPQGAGPDIGADERTSGTSTPNVTVPVPPSNLTLR